MQPLLASAQAHLPLRQWSSWDLALSARGPLGSGEAILVQGGSDSQAAFDGVALTACSLPCERK